MISGLVALGLTAAEAAAVAAAVAAEGGAALGAGLGASAAAAAPAVAGTAAAAGMGPASIAAGEMGAGALMGMEAPALAAGEMGGGALTAGGGTPSWLSDIGALVKDNAKLPSTAQDWMKLSQTAGNLLGGPGPARPAPLQRGSNPFTPSSMGELSKHLLPVTGAAPAGRRRGGIDPELMERLQRMAMGR